MLFGVYRGPPSGQEVAHNAGGYGGNDWPNSIVLERDCTVGITWTLTDDGAF